MTSTSFQWVDASRAAENSIIATEPEESSSSNSDMKDDELLPRVLELFTKFCSFGSAKGGDDKVAMDGPRCADALMVNSFVLLDPPHHHQVC